MKYTNVVLCSIAVFGLVACATPAKVPVAAVAEKCVFPGSTNAAPSWICDEHVDGMTVGAVGTSAKSEAGYGFMKQMAMTEARVQLAQNMRVHVQNMVKQYAETTGAVSKETVDRANTVVTKQITDETLVGTKPFKSIEAPDGTLYVLVGLDEVAAQKLAETAISTSMTTDRAVWQQFRARKGQDELAADIAKQKVEFDKSKQ
jgi:hypothetical protein